MSGVLEEDFNREHEVFAAVVADRGQRGGLVQDGVGSDEPGAGNVLALRSRGVSPRPVRASCSRREYAGSSVGLSERIGSLRSGVPVSAATSMGPR